MEGGYKSTRIVRDHDGNIEAVLITGSEAGAHDLTVSYFPGRGSAKWLGRYWSKTVPSLTPTTPLIRGATT